MGADKACSHPHQPGHTCSQSGHSHPEQPFLSSRAATTTRPGPLQSQPPNPRAHGTNPQSARHPALRTPGLTHPLRLRNLPAFQLGKLQGCRLRLRYHCWTPGGDGTHPGAPSGRSELPSGAHTTLRHAQFERELAQHPDKAWVSTLIQGLRHGFRLGYTGPRTTTHARNLISSFHHPDAIDRELAKERAAGRIIGPFAAPTPPATLLRPGRSP